MSQSAKAVFDRDSGRYDATRRQLIPCFDDLYGTVADLVAERAPEDARILDLGGGTGLLTSLVAASRPQASFVVTDVSEGMLAKATDRFAGSGLAVEVRVMDHLDLAEQGAYDVVMSALSIHHLEDGDKQAVYRRAARALKDGGIFINADQVAGDTPEMEQRYWRHWRDAATAAGIAPAELEAAIERQKLDRRAPLAPQLEWLQRAGLTEVECRYKNVSFAVLCGLWRAHEIDLETFCENFMY
jgi:tRNA (cmo5U34)-methyltransferase